MEMFTTNLSVFSSWRLPERIFRVLLRSIDRKRQKVFLSQCTAVDMASCQLVDFQKAPGLKIAKTTLPDERLDFNQTFEQIRFGLDDFYKERNPIFNNLLVSEGEGSRPAIDQAKKRLFTILSGPDELVEIYHKEESGNGACVPNADISPLWIAKTTIPEGRRDFNETFFHIRNEIEKIYKEQNPVFNNTISPELWLNREAKAERQEDSVKESSCHKSVRENHSEESDSGISETSFSSPEGAETAFSIAGSPLPEAFECHYSQMVNADQDQSLVPEDEGSGWSAYIQNSLAGSENFTGYQAGTDPLAKPVAPPLAEEPEEGAGSPVLTIQEKKKRKTHRPARMSWNFVDRKERRQEKIPGAEPGLHEDEEHSGRIINESMGHAG